jgi:hypothetical protein
MEKVSKSILKSYTFLELQLLRDLPLHFLLLLRLPPPSITARPLLIFFVVSAACLRRKEEVLTREDKAITGVCDFFCCPAMIEFGAGSSRPATIQSSIIDCSNSIAHTSTSLRARQIKRGDDKVLVPYTHTRCHYRHYHHDYCYYYVVAVTRLIFIHTATEQTFSLHAKVAATAVAHHAKCNE